MRAESTSHRCSLWHALYAADDAASHAAKSIRLAPPLAGLLAGLLLFGLTFNVAAHAQGPGQAITGRPPAFDAAENASPGKTMDGFWVQQSLEVGGRFTEVTGNGDMYNTLVDLHTGPRLLEQSLTMQALPDHRSFFDSLYEESFGWGGDPSNALRLRVSKHGIYNFDGSFRRDQNFVDFNLLANPLNPAATGPSVPFSPHSYFLRRRMYDFNLVIFPQRKLSVNLSFSRNRNEGPSFSSIHEGTEALLFQPYNTTDDIYRLGLAYRALPKTTITFNESLQSIKNDTDYFLAPSALQPPGLPTDPTILSTGAGANTYTDYFRLQRYRNFLPTEQATLTSSSIPHVDLTARFMYSNVDAETPLFENFAGLITRTGLNAFCSSSLICANAASPAAFQSGSIGNWVSEQADGGATIHITPHLRIVDSFRFYAYRIPGLFNLQEANLFAAYTTSSPADFQNELFQRFSQQSWKSNEFDLQYDISRQVGVRVGYLYRNIFDGHNWVSTDLIGNIFLPGNTGVTANCINQGLTFDPATGNCTGVFDSEDEAVEINQHWGIAGIWFRPNRKVHVDGEVRIMSADSFLNRIDPRREQQYRANVTFLPKNWLTLTANVNLREQRNNSQDFAYNAHYRNFGFSATATHNRFMADVSYMYSNYGQNANVCYIPGTFTAPTPNPVFACINDPALTETLGFYLNHSHFGSASVQFRPVHRVTVGAGYSIVKVDDGSSTVLILNPQQPLGPLGTSYQQIFGLIGFQVVKNVEFRAGWNYYQYNDNNLPVSGVAPVVPSRYFHANVTTASLRYAF